MCDGRDSPLIHGVSSYIEAKTNRVVSIPFYFSYFDSSCIDVLLSI